MSGAGLGANEAKPVRTQEKGAATGPRASRPAAGTEPGEGPHQALVASVRPGAFARMRESVWMPVVLKAAGIFAGMMALAGIGAWSTLSGAGVPVALASAAPSTSVAASAAPPPLPPVAASSGSAPGASAAPSVTPPAAPAAAGITADGRVILNLATGDELTKLPRVGPKRAENIIALRQKVGRFKQPTDLLRVKGIGRKTLQLMLPKLVVDAPK